MVYSLDGIRVFTRYKQVMDKQVTHVTQVTSRLHAKIVLMLRVTGYAHVTHILHNCNMCVTCRPYYERDFRM